MLGGLEEFFRSNPVGLLFAVLGLGYLVGKTMRQETDSCRTRSPHQA
jgi:hypothetical protein